MDKLLYFCETLIVYHQRNKGPTAGMLYKEIYDSKMCFPKELCDERSLYEEGTQRTTGLVGDNSPRNNDVILKSVGRRLIRPHWQSKFKIRATQRCVEILDWTTFFR